VLLAARRRVQSGYPRAAGARQAATCWRWAERSVWARAPGSRRLAPRRRRHQRREPPSPLARPRTGRLGQRPQPAEPTCWPDWPSRRPTTPPQQRQQPI